MKNNNIPDLSNKVYDYDDIRNEDYHTYRNEQNTKNKDSYSTSGSRYFRVEPGYDKHIYENDWKNIIVIIGTFTVFYICGLLYWWGMIAFGTAFPEEAKWYSVATLLFTIAWLIGMLISGHFAN